MSSKELAWEFLEEHGIPFRKSDSYEKLANRLDEVKVLDFGVDEVRSFFRTNWTSCPINMHLSNLKSGLLEGHAWHGAMPSMLHFSMQNKVRNCTDGHLTLPELINIGSDIMKHEYFLVAAHDLLESAIIKAFDEVIPPVGSKSISDFVFSGVPYDLKNTKYFGDWDRTSVNANKAEVAELLFRNADVARLRKQAQKSLYGWGLNRFYVMVEDQDRWLQKPENLLKEVCNEAMNLGDSMKIQLEELTIQTQMIAI